MKFPVERACFCVCVFVCLFVCLCLCLCFCARPGMMGTGVWVCGFDLGAGGRYFVCPQPQGGDPRAPIRNAPSHNFDPLVTERMGPAGRCQSSVASACELLPWVQVPVGCASIVDGVDARRKVSLDLILQTHAHGYACSLSHKNSWRLRT